MPQIGKCPHCLVEIDYLEYKQNIAEYGRSNLNGEDIECNDSECNEITFYCPECNEEIFNPEENIIYKKEKKEKKEKTTEINNGEISDILTTNRTNTRINKKNFITCNKCQSTIEITDKEYKELNKIECWNCNKMIKIPKET